MADLFAVALGTLHRGPGAVAAVYTAPGGSPMGLRVVHEQPSEIAGGDMPAVILDTHRFHLRVADVGEPEAGATIALGELGDGSQFRITGDPLLDSEGVSWSCPAEPL